MSSLIDLIKRRKNITYQEASGLNLAVYLINEYKDRNFTFKGFKRKYSGINGEELLTLLQREMESSLVVYRYTTQLKKYCDRKGVSHMKIRLIGKASMLSRFNPLDVEMNIVTEKVNK